MVLNVYHYLPYEVLREITEVIRPRHIRMCEEVLVRVVRFIAIPQEELEQMEETEPVQTVGSTLRAQNERTFGKFCSRYLL